MAQLYLDTNDFHLRQGTNGMLLCTDIPNLSVVLFYQPPPRCQYSAILLPIFRDLPRALQGPTYATVNIAVNRRLVLESQRTLTPITYTPMILVYVNGRPFVEYKYQYTMDQIQAFIIKAYELAKQAQAEPNQVVHHKNVRYVPNRIPQYSLGLPIMGDDMHCYITIDEMDQWAEEAKRKGYKALQQRM